MNALSHDNRDGKASGRRGWLFRRLVNPARPKARQPLTGPALRIWLMRRSLFTFVWGIFSLLPVIGFSLGLGVLAYWVCMRPYRTREWNPAVVYLRWGIGLALLGVTGSALILYYWARLVFLSGQYSIYNNLY